MIALVGRQATCTRADYGLEQGRTYTIIVHDGSFVAVEDEGHQRFGIRDEGNFAGRPTIGLDRFSVASPRNQQSEED